MVSDETLNELERLSSQCDQPPWVAIVEGRDATSDDSFIRTGPDGDRGEDVYVTRDSGPAGATYLDLLAASRTFLPLLVRELRELRGRDSAISTPPLPREPPHLVLPPDFDAYGWEVVSKGVLFSADVQVGARHVEVVFYDPTRLAQDIEAEHVSGHPVAIQRLIVVESLTIENMERAVRDLPSSFFETS